MVHPPLFGDPTPRIGEEQVRQLVIRSKGIVALHRISADAHDLRRCICELFDVIAKATGFPRAHRRLVLRIEEKYDGTFFAELTEAPRLTGVISEFEIWC